MEFLISVVVTTFWLVCNPVAWLVGLLSARGGALPLWRVVGTMTANLVSVLLLLKASGDPTGMPQMIVGSLLYGAIIGFVCSFFKRTIK